MPTPLSPPPRIKYLEALGTLADGRITELSGSEAEVRSSEGSRVYRVRLDVEKGTAESDDNGTLYRDYVGYPIIALMIKQGRLPYDEELAGALRGIKWRTLNEQLKSYRRVEEEVKKRLAEKGIPPSRVDEYIRLAEKRLKMIRLTKP